LAAEIVNPWASGEQGLIIQANRSALLLIDLQSRLLPVIANAGSCLDHCQVLLRAARLLDVPVRASEHCPDGIGPTVPDLRDLLQPEEILAKRHFDGSAEAGFLASLKALERSTIVVAGTEAHVCVLQTVLGLKGRGFAPVLVADATSSRTASSRDLAIERLRHHGIDIVSTEMVIFEWLKAGGTPAFKELLPMIKAGRVEGS
jgi:nicotinamidase-related amidase